MSRDTANPISPIEVGKDLVLDRCKFLVDVHVWPLQNKLDPDGWLTNFTEDEMPYAVQMLHSFMYFSDDMVDQLLVAAFQGLSRAVVPPDADFGAAQKSWTDLRTNAIITRITGEVPSEADSGYVFTRKARQILGIPEGNLLSPSATLKSLVTFRKRPVIFVDDFVGSGRQCVTLWSKRFPDSGTSFEELASDPRCSFYYTPLICTSDGLKRLSRECSGLIVRATHVLPKNYSYLAPNSIFWPDSLKNNAFDVLRKMSARAGIMDALGADVDSWQGFHKLGLGLAFYHGVPDATLPLFYWEENGWKPLVRSN